MEKVEELEVQLRAAQLAQMHAIQVSEQADAATSATKPSASSLRRSLIICGASGTRRLRMGKIAAEKN